MSWRVAKSLEKLRTQLNALYPERSKVSDGSIGDAAHASRNSDHNPWIKDSKGVGVVTARDFTHDESEGGLNGHQLLSALLASKDKRIKYIIFFSKIYNVKDGFAPRKYTGINAHKHHLHISVSSNPVLFDDDSDWNLDFSKKFEVQPQVTSFELARGAKGEPVRKLQEKLFEMGYLKSSDIDSAFGIRTQSALQRFQKDVGLIADGIAGPKTFEKLGL